MKFSYDDYFAHCLLVPMVICVFVSLNGVFAIVISIKQIITNGFSTGITVSFLFSLFFDLYFFRLGARILSNGGIYLIKEKAAESRKTEGTVEEVAAYDVVLFPKNKNKYQKYGIRADSKNISGCKIVVDEMVLKAPEKGALSPGDRVSVTFLPKSGYILAINKIGDEITTLEQESDREHRLLYNPVPSGRLKTRDSGTTGQKLIKNLAASILIALIIAALILFFFGKW